MNYSPVIGLEVHVELKTNSKMFCRCSADYFGKKPNTHTCPVCLGLPGALPVPNKTAIDWCVMIGLALNCDIPLFSKFDRKNYFYPDLAKGYQISQYDEPFAINGSITLSTGKKIGITRVHMEEDTGKLLHADVKGESASLIDFNRSGVPLVEIVTEPDFDSASEVVEYLKKLQQIVRYLGVSNADMEKGDMRLEPNISLQVTRNTTHEEKNKLRVTSHELPNYKVEVKNINSFRFVEKAIKYEIERQAEILDEDKRPSQETRGWDEKKQKTVSQRLKEEANDYRYFPEPDIPPIRWTESQLSEVRSKMPELPHAKLQRFKNEYGLSDYDTEIVTREKETADFFEEAIRVAREISNGKSQISNKTIANFIINKKVKPEDMLPAELIKHIQSSTQTATINEGELDKIIEKVLSENEKAVLEYKSGKESVIMFLVGQVMRSYKQKIDAQQVRQKIESKLN